LKFPSSCWKVLGITRKTTELSAYGQDLDLVSVKCRYTYPSLFMGLWFHKFVGLPQEEEYISWTPSVVRSIKIVQQLAQVRQPYHMMFKVLKKVKKHLSSQCFCKKKKLKKY
jgi:hypothetical protein